MAGDGYACWGGCKTVQVSLHMVEAVRGDGFILLQSNSPFAYQACCLWEGGEDYESQKWGCANLISFVEETLKAGGLLVDGNRCACLLSNPGCSTLPLARVGVCSRYICSRASNRMKRSIRPSPSAIFPTHTMGTSREISKRLVRAL